MRQENILPNCSAIAERPSTPWKGLFFLAVVFVVWGSTYLTIRVAVSPAGGFPPFALGAVRLVSAGLAMLAGAALLGRTVRLGGRELAVLAATGTFLWLGGNGLVVWALTRVDSGYAALLMGTMPIFAAVLDAAVDRRMPSARTLVGLALGVGGIAALSGPGLGGAAAVAGMIALLLAALSWAVGSVYSARRTLEVDPVVSAGWILLFGGIGFGMVSLLSGEPVPQPSPAAWGALAYLIVVGSVIGFGAYVMALRLLPSDLVMTHAYVNPVVAVILGWAVLGESMSIYTAAGAALVVLGVYQVFRGRVTS